VKKKTKKITIIAIIKIKNNLKYQIFFNHRNKNKMENNNKNNNNKYMNMIKNLPNN
jgi:hypothetical protein